jgi:hypothetical protein
MPPQLLPDAPTDDDPLLRPSSPTGRPRSALLSDLHAPPAPTAPAPRGPQSMLLSDLNQDQQLARAVQQSKDTSAGQAVRVLQVQQKTGLPAAVIERNLDDFEKQIAAPGFDADTLRRTSPALASWLAEDAQRVALAREDLDQLGTIEWLLKVPKTAFHEKRAQQRYSELRRRDTLFGTALTDAERAEMGTLQTTLQAQGNLTSASRPRRWVLGLANMLGDQVPVYYAAADYGEKGMYGGAAVGTAIGAIGGTNFLGIGAVPGAGAGAVIGGQLGMDVGVAAGVHKGVLKSTFDQEYAGAFDEYSTMTDEAGRPMDPRVAKLAAAAVGAANAGFELWAERLFARAIPGLGEVMGMGGNPVRARIRQLLTKPTYRAALLEAGKAYGKAIGGEIAVEDLQQLLTITGRAAGVAVSNELPPAPAGSREDGTAKGEGFLGVFRTPSGEVMSEFSIADSEDPRLRGPNGEHLDYPTLVPTLTREEIQTLVNRREGDPVPESIKQKAEAHALARIEKGEPVFAQPGEQHLDIAPDVARVDTSKRLAQPGLEQIGQEMLENTVGAFDAFALGLIPGPITSAISETARTRQLIRAGELNRALFQALHDGVQASKTGQAFPPAMAQFIDHAAEGGGIKDTFIPIDSWTQYWQTKGADPKQMATELTGDPNAYDHAVKEQKPLQLKTSVYATRLAPTEHHTFFADEVKLGSPTVPNGRETRQLNEQLAGELTAAMREKDPRVADLAQKLAAAGTRHFIADPYAHMAASLVNVMSERQGLRTADDRYAQLNIEITREGINDEATRTAAAEGLAPDAAAPVDIPPSTGTDNETPTQRTAREQAHLQALTAEVIKDAQRQDPTVSAARIRSAVEQRLDARHEGLGAAEEAGQGRALLEKIARLGGLWFHERTGTDRGEMEWLDESRDSRVTRSGHVVTDARRPATWNGVAGVVRPGDGKTLDGMVEALREEGIHFETPNELWDAITSALRAKASTLGTLPGTAELESELGIRLGTRWWDPRGTIETDGYSQQRTEEVAGLQSTGLLREGLEQGGTESAGAARRGDDGGVARPDDHVGAGDRGRGSTDSQTQRQAGAASSVARDRQRRDDVGAAQLGEQLPSDLLAAVTLYRDRLDAGPRNMNALAQAMRDVGARLPMDRGRARVLLAHLLDVAHDTTTYSQLPGFYSRLTRAVETSTLQKASGAQWKATIRNAKGGIAADEFALANVDDLDDGTTYTRADVLAYLAANELTVVPATFQDVALSPEAVDERAYAIFDQMVDEAVEQAERNGRHPDVLVTEAQARETDDGRWQGFYFDAHADADVDVDGSYDTEAEALQAAEAKMEDVRQQAEDEFRADIGSEINFDAIEDQARAQLQQENGAHFATYTMAGPSSDYREVMLAVPNLYRRQGESYGQAALRLYGKHPVDLNADEANELTERLNGWHDGHQQYDSVENPIVRLRFNTREVTGADGTRQKVLFLEEVQPPQKEEFAKMPPLLQKRWRDLALKWALHHAVEMGADAVAWTPGGVQVDRYSLVNHVHSMTWGPGSHSGAYVRVVITPAQRANLETPDTYGAFSLNVLKADGKVAAGTFPELVGKPLDVIVGKDLAKQILEEPEGTRAGEGLTIGGHGLRDLYDKDLPNTMRSLAVVKKGGGTLETVPIVKERLPVPLPASLFALNDAMDRYIAAEQWRRDNPDTPVTMDAPAIAITPEMRAQIEQGQPLFHGDDDELGFIRFRRRDGQLVGVHIGLLRGADLSTFIHEVGHFAFEFMGDLVEELQPLDPTTLTDTQKTLMADYHQLLAAAAVATGVPADSRADIQEVHHEWIARAMEGYVREGRAPSLELRSAFARMSAWLLDIYKTLRRLNVELTPDVRGIFDRMLASDAAIAEAEREAHVTPLFTDAAHAGLSPLEFASYQDQVREASVAKQEELRARVLREFQREKTSWWQEEQDATRAQVETELQQDPTQRAVSILRRGVNPDGTLPDGTPLEEDQAAPQVKLSRDSLKAQFGPAMLKRLPKGLYSADSGNSADTVAAWLRDVGVHFPNGDALVRALIAARPFDRVVAEETHKRMAAKHGDLMEGGGLRAAAQRVVEGEHHAEVVHAELAALTKGMAATTIPPAETLNHMARERIAQTPNRDLQPQLHLQAARHASQRAFTLLGKGDRAGAVQAKLQELLNLALYRAARDAQDGLDTMRRRLQGYTTTAARQRFGKAGGNHLAQIDALLGRFELAPITRRERTRRQSLAEYIERQKEVNPDQPLDIDASLLDESRRRNYLDMTFGEFQAVHDAVEQIAHIASLKNRLLKAVRQRTFEEARDELHDSILTNNTVHTMPLEESDREKRLAKIANSFATLSKIGHLARALDGHHDGGLFWEYIIRPLNAASDDEFARKAAAGARLRELWKLYTPLERRNLGAQIFVPGLNASVSKEFRLMVALNWGNEDNRARLLNDPTRHWTLAQLQAIVDTLDERDWRFVQGVLDYIEEFWPEIAEKQRRVTGLAPEKVQATPIETRFGTFRGGYFPIVFDLNRVARAEAFAVANEEKLRMQAGYVSQATTARGHTKERQRNVKMSLRLEFGVIGDHIDQVVHDLTHHEALIDVGRLLGDHDIQAAVLATKGPAVYRQFKSALRDIAVGPQTGGPLTSWARWLRTRSQFAGLALNLWSGVQQPLGVFNGARRVGPRWVAKGMAKWLRNTVKMEKTAEWIWERSSFMRARGDTATQDLADLRSELARPGGYVDLGIRSVTRDAVTKQDILDSATWHIGLFQRFADIATWLGAYEKAAADAAQYTAEGTLDEARVVALADQAVIDSQGSGLVKDLSAAQRSNEWMKLFLTFYSYGNTVYNELSDALGAAGRKETRLGSVGTFLGHFSQVVIFPALGTVAIAAAMGRRHHDDGDDDGLDAWAKELGVEMLATMFNTVPLVRELGNGAIMLATGETAGARGYEGPAALRPITAGYRFMQQLGQGEADQAAIRATTQLAGVLFRFPAAQVQRTMNGYAALEEGRTQNPFALVVGAPAGAR